MSQRLLPEATNQGRVVATELLLSNSAIASLIRDGKTNLIDNVIQTSLDEGMVFFERSLLELYKTGKISRETAINYSLRHAEITKLMA